MDIRKFFGGQSATKKAAEPIKNKNDTPKTKKEAPPRNDTRKNVKQSVGADSPNKKKKGASSPRKKNILEDEDAVIVDVSDEEVIKNSQTSSKGGKISQIKSESKSVISKVDKEAKSNKNVSIINNEKNEQHTTGVKKKYNTNTEDDGDFIEMLSVKSRDSSRSSSRNRKDSQRNGSKYKDNSKNNSAVETERNSSLSRSSKEKTSHGEAKRRKSRQKNQVSSDDEELDDDAIQVDESSDDEQEEVITSRKRPRKASSKKLKKAQRALDSDSEEDPLPKDKPKRKKKEMVTFVDDSDGEKKETAMDKFVIHNASSNLDADKTKTASKNEDIKGKPVSVMDFFGTDTVARSDRTTAAAKRKHEEVDKVEEIDLTFDDELHDDDDFLKTLDQLDGPSVKKVKSSEIHKKEADNTQNKGSLASKLVNKMKMSPSDNPDQQTKKGNNSSVKEITLSPMKNKSVSKPTSKNSKVYTMEVTRIKPPTVVVSPVKSKQEEEKTPLSQKGPITPAKAEKKEAAGKDNDNGFGTKAIGGYLAFKSRSGPQALGSREPPEGAENCLEGLTFVITGVLDTMERDDAKEVIERHGGKVTGNISRKTSYVIVGREAGESKLLKARDFKVKQVDEDGLYDMIKTLPGKTSKYEIQAKEQMKKEEASQKKIQLEAEAAAAKKLQSFRSEKDIRNFNTSSSTSSSSGSPFTQIKGSLHATSVTSPSSSKLLDQSKSPSQKQRSQVANQPDSLLWVDKHKPTNIKQIIGQQGEKSCAKKLLHWLQSWHHNVLVKKVKPSGNFFGKGDGAGCRAALLSGPPGIGKTTTATLVCQDVGFSFVELNASDTRSKRSLKEVVSESLNNQTLVDYMGDHSGTPSGQSHCVIMDEVDGMAGNEDRGGLQELVQLIKTTKIPIICICNDRNSMKMRTLSNYCLDLRFQRPRLEQIKGAMLSLAYREGVKIPSAAVNEIIVASNHDIRQVIHNISMWSAGNKSLTFEQVKKDAQKAQKDMKMGPFDVCRKVFVSDEETRKMSIHEKSDLFFQDYSFGPLFVHENYPHVIPHKAQGHHSSHLSCLARTIDSICDGDLLDKTIRKEGNWNLLPVQAMYSSVIPGEIMRGSFPQMPDFPQWLGKFSTTNKNHRILQELGTHMRLETSCDKRGLNLDYLPALRSCLTSPLVSLGSEGVSEVIKVMDEYDIIKEDFDNIMDITKWSNSVDPMSKLDSKTKAAFTRQYNKEIHMTPYATGVVSKKRRAKASAIDESDFPQEDEEGVSAGVESEAEDEDLAADTMIKTKKPSTSGKNKGESQQTGKGRNKGKADAGKGKADGGKGKAAAGKGKAAGGKGKR